MKDNKPQAGRIRLNTQGRDRKVDLVVLGELNVDLLLYGNVVPAFGQAEKLVEDAALTVGSSSAIFAHQAARLGLQVTFAGKVGEDTFGHFMLDRLQEAGIDITEVVVDPGIKTGITLHLVREDDRAMLTYPGSIAAMRAEEVGNDLLRTTRHVHVGSYFLQEGLQEGLPELFACAQEAGATTSLDPGWDPAESWNSGLHEVLNHTDVFIPNEQELLAVAGEEDLESALKHFAHVPTVVVKRGAEGAVARGEGVLVSCKPPRVRVADTTGAGDNFDAGFLFGVLRGEDLERALQIGCICGALSTKGHGGVEGQPDINDVERFLLATFKEEDSA